MKATNSSKVTQLVLCIRWVDGNLDPHEEFIDLHYMNVTNADYIVKVIKVVVLRMNLSLNKCRGQCSVATQLKLEEIRAILIPCYGHSLNLAVGDDVTGSKIMKNALETTHDITKLIKSLQNGMPNFIK